MNKLIFTVLLMGFSVTAFPATDAMQSSLYHFQMRMAQQGSTEAAFLVGEMNEEGRGTAQNLPEAVAWYKRAAEKGHPEASRKVEQLGHKPL